MPAPMAQGVLGMARTTATSLPNAFSMWLVGTEAATEMMSCLLETLGRICSITSCTTCGFTHTKMMSALRTAARLSVPTETPSFSARARARSSCWTVAKVALGESRPFSSSALSRIPPILPAPSTATRFPEKSKLITLCPPWGLWSSSAIVQFHVDDGDEDNSWDFTDCVGTGLRPVQAEQS